MSSLNVERMPASRPAKMGVTKSAPQEIEAENVERDTKEDLTALQASFRDRAKQENARFKNATDSEYWCCLCFQSREQKEEFLKQLGLMDLGDKYLDGREVAARMGVALSDSGPRRFLKQKPDRKLNELAHSLRENVDGEEETS